MRTVLVTAATGNAGKNTVDALLAKGFRVVAAARTPANIAFTGQVDARRYDANAETDFGDLLKDVDDVVLVAPPLDGSVHEKVAPLIYAAAAKGINHLVHLSGSYLAGMTGQTLDDLTVRKIEVLVRDSGLKHTIVRAGFFMDNYLTGFYAPMVSSGTIDLATGAGKSALISGADVGAYIAEALSQGVTGERLVTGPEALDHVEVAELLSRKLDRKITYNPLSEDQLREAYSSRDLPAQNADYGLTLYRAYRNFATAAITDGFKQVTGRDPVTFKEFLGLT